MVKKLELTRRDLLKTSAMVAGALTMTSAGLAFGEVQGSDTIRVGVIGCGGRGSGAATDCVASSKGVEIVALADAFQDRVDGLKGKYKVPDNRCFVGLDAYKQLLALDDINLVILATPPGFRPIHFAAAIEAGKNVFTEKPVAVCPAGIKMFKEAAEKAKAKKLAVVAGTQRRHEPRYIETMKRIHDGAIGEIVSAQCYWNQGGLWNADRTDKMTDIEWQLRNWLYFTWLSGDHIVEQHVHNIDVINWAMGSLPEVVHALGGRQFRTDPKFGHIFDHFGTEFIYPNDVRTISMCRQIEGASDRVSERVVGTKGTSDCCGTIWGENPWTFDDKGTPVNPYVQEHADLIESIRKGEPLNEGVRVADSTQCAIMARESAYTMVQFKRSWFENKCTLNLLPSADLKMDTPKPVPPVAVPGQYELAGFPKRG
jgi:predicted dehydrogenase